MVFKVFFTIFIALTFFALFTVNERKSYQQFLFQSGNKVHLYLEDLKDVDLNIFERISYQLFGYPNFKVKQNTQLSYLVKTNCILNPNLQQPEYIDSEREPSQVKTLKKYADSKSIKVVLTKDTPINTLKKDAESNDCVLGISHNHLAYATEDFDLQLNRVEKFNNMINSLSKNMNLNLNQNLTPVVVAVIDTGIDYDHEALRPYIWFNSTELNGLPDYDDDGNGYKDDVYGYNFPDLLGDPSHKTVNDHGTHVAGLVLSSYFYKSNAHPIKIMALNVYGRNWGAETVDIDNAIKYAADNGANIINISIGGPGHSDTTAQAIDYAIQKGATVVASVGNLETNIDNEFYFPASYAYYFNGMISVGAQDVKLNSLCSFSNFGQKTVEVAAPGCDKDAPKNGIYSTRSKNRYGYKKGTSQAAPLISGVAANIYAQVKVGTLSPPELEKQLIESANSNADLRDFIEDGHYINFTESTLNNEMQR